jgi:hypothetical protein
VTCWIRRAAIVALCNAAIIRGVDRVSDVQSSGSSSANSSLAIVGQAATPLPESASLVLFGAALVAMTFRYRGRADEKRP